MKLADMTRDDLEQIASQSGRELELSRGNRMALDLTRGKPAADQLDLASAMDTPLDSYVASDGTDARNYGGLRGLPEARELGADLIGIPADQVIAIGNSSLFLMYITFRTALTRGLWNDDRNWSRVDAPAVLAPVPGYDRHFSLTERLGVEMVNVAMTDTGPDMDAAEALVRENANIKAIWCVPKYQNPVGCIFSDETVQRMAELPKVAAADDFVVFWDNAYAVHDFEFPRAPLADLYTTAQAAGTADHMLLFASTSKITYASGGIGFVGGTDTVLDVIEDELSMMLIGPDKVSQLRHTRFLNGRVEEHMAGHAALLKPKFELVEQILNEQLGDLDIAQWTQPAGGYFVSMEVMPGTARRIVETAESCGLTLTRAGATFPYGKDPADSNIRIAPTFASLEDLKLALDLLTTCVKHVTAQKLLES